MISDNFQRARNMMVENQLRPNKINDKNILKLFNNIKKEDFLYEEIKENPSSRSAKLRFAIKKTDFYDFDTDIYDQFKHLIEIENFGDKL